MIQSCHACQMTSTPPRAPPVVMSELPNGPWKKIGIDLTGPFGSNNEYILAAIDYYSRFPMIEIITSTTSTTIINKLRQMFALHGLVDEIVTDNASYFVSSTFKAFLRENGIKHIRSSPYWSRNNGLVENFNKSLKKAVRIAQVQNKNWRTELYTFLLHYRGTEHSTTGVSPAQLLYGRQIKTKLPQFDRVKTPKGLKARDAQQKQKIKENADRTKAKAYKTYTQGQKVLILKREQNKMSPNWEKQIFKVVRQKGTSLKLLSNSGGFVFRNVTHVRPYFERQRQVVQEQIDRKEADRTIREKRRTVLPRKYQDYKM